MAAPWRTLPAQVSAASGKDCVMVRTVPNDPIAELLAGRDHAGLVGEVSSKEINVSFSLT